jgi:hypothetical protein
MFAQQLQEAAESAAVARSAAAAAAAAAGDGAFEYVPHKYCRRRDTAVSNGRHGMRGPGFRDVGVGFRGMPTCVHEREMRVLLLQVADALRVERGGGGGGWARADLVASTREELGYRYDGDGGN